MNVRTSRWDWRVIRRDSVEVMHPLDLSACDFYHFVYCTSILTVKLTYTPNNHLD
jgi:hypothetical protein